MRRAPVRLVPLEGAFNFRDLGGYPVVGGGRTRWGCLYRSDGLQDLTEADAAALGERHLATVIDLRTDVELERWGRGLIGDAPIRWEHLSVLRAEGGESVAAPETDDLAERYLWYLEVGGRPVARALEVLAEPGATPAVFHCAAGKDRTGVLAALILDAIGVEPEAIVTDYAETSAHLDPILERLAANAPPTQPSVPPSRLTVEPATMERFLERLQQRYGGAAKWMVAASGDASLPERLAQLLVER